MNILAKCYKPSATKIVMNNKKLIMKYLQRILTIAAVFILIAAFQPIHAQSDINTNRMNRDINIMENVLEEIFKTSWSADGSTVRVRSGMFSFGDSRGINGTFLPDYGIIFSIPGGAPGFVMFSGSEGDSHSFHFEYGDESNGEEVTEETITNKMVEFLRDYASTISQLNNDHKVMVIYKANKSRQQVTVFNSSDDSKEARQQLPTISVVATGADLRAHRNGSLNDSEFRDRLEINSVPADTEPQKDMRVMASILETGFDGSEENAFRIRGSVDHLLLDNFGALFSFEARYDGSRSHFDLSGLHESLETMKEDLAQTRVQMKETRAKLKGDSQAIDSIRSERKKENEENRAQQKQKVLEAYNEFVADLKEYLVDYGRTLRSVDSNQQILVSVTLDSRYEEIPERIDLQLQKSALENRNPEQAVNKINVREY